MLRILDKLLLFAMCSCFIFHLEGDYRRVVIFIIGLIVAAWTLYIENRKVRLLVRGTRIPYEEAQKIDEEVGLQRTIPFNLILLIGGIIAFIIICKISCYILMS